MAFGFGFNKQKVLSAAEKYVQQGKMQNAIAEYEKVIKADPKDLTVTNTIGDLYSRLGDADKATECFKTVGDAYASQGFTVKAIAMYKKISKLKPSLESVLKLAELYTQQGLFNDARSQYLQVAEEFIKSGELENAVRIFQKILEMDPENSAMRIKLAEVYVRLGKKTEAWQIFSAAAETLRGKGNLTAADEVLQRMLTLDPGNSYALLLQGRNLLANGDAEGAIASLQKVPDLDSNPEGLRDLLQAYLKTGRLSDAGALASKLLSVHNDLSAIATLADALMQAGQYENALQVYDQHSDRMLAEDSDKVIKNLHAIIGHVRDNPDSLEKLIVLFHKAGESTHINEVTELLAHASVQSGDLPRARDLYQKLASAEPGNPLHMNHYQQVVSQLGGPSAERLISAEEAVVIVDELEAASPAVHQHYPDAVALALRAALTDAELFISYNMPAKALGPLMAALPQAPSDLRLNQRLAALHTRAGRFAEAGVCCRAIQIVLSDAGYPEEATAYGELAERYERRAAAEGSANSSQAADTDEARYLAESTAPEQIGDLDQGQDLKVARPVSVSSPWPSAPPQAAGEPEFSVLGDPTAEAQEEKAYSEPAPTAVAETEVAAAGEEIDLSSEWDDSLTVEAASLPPGVDASQVDAPAQSLELGSAGIDPAQLASSSAPRKPIDPEKAAEAIEEIRFYLEHGMPEQAAAAFQDLQGFEIDDATLATLRAEIEGGGQSAPQEQLPVVEAVSAFSPEPAAEEETLEIAAPVDEIAAPLDEAAVEQTIRAEPVPMEGPALELEVVAPAPASQTVLVSAEVEALPADSIPAKIEAEENEAEKIEPPAEPVALQEFVSDLEASLGEAAVHKDLAVDSGPGSAVAVATDLHPASNDELEPVGQAAPTVFGVSQNQMMGEFVAEIEASLGDDFLKDAPLPSSEIPPAAPSAPAPSLAGAAPRKLEPAALSPGSAPLAASAAAASGGPAISSHAAPTQSSAALPSALAPVKAVLPSLTVKASPFGEEASIDLSEMFGELKDHLEAGSDEKNEDPETHYNLGIAFREMGLLDEAIGELQKTCQAVDRGHAFPNIMQTYTWLAQCFIDKGVPQAAIRWYDKALHSPGIDEDTRTALHYELASAYDSAGDRPSAVKHFMEVYGRNIDYRDVAERIKAMKS
jgi:tetratricopeptide (TPR) repeat protein